MGKKKTTKKKKSSSKTKTILKVQDPKILDAFSSAMLNGGVIPALKVLGVELVPPCSCRDGSDPEWRHGPNGPEWVCPDGSVCR